MTAVPAQLTLAELRARREVYTYLIDAMEHLPDARLTQVDGYVAIVTTILAVKPAPLTDAQAGRILAAVMAAVPDVDPPDLGLEPADGRTWAEPSSDQEHSADALASVEEGPAAASIPPQGSGGDTQGDARRAWTPEEDARLLRLRAEGLTLRQIAAGMQRTKGSIEARTAELRMRQRAIEREADRAAQRVAATRTPAPGLAEHQGAGRAGAPRASAHTDDAPVLSQEDWRGEGLIRSAKRRA